MFSVLWVNYNSFREFAKTEVGPILALFQSKMSKSFSNWCIQFLISWFYSLEYWSERFSLGGGGGLIPAVKAIK